MRRSYRKIQNTTSENRFDAVDVARWAGFLIFSLLALVCFGADHFTQTSMPRELGNPLEREFFTDRAIQQVSAEEPGTMFAASGTSVWDNPQPADNVPDWRQTVQPETPYPRYPAETASYPMEAQYAHYPVPMPQFPQPALPSGMNNAMMQPGGNDGYYNPYLQAQPFEQYAMSPYAIPNPYSVQPWMSPYGHNPMNPAGQPDWQQNPLSAADPQQALMQLFLQQEYQRHQQSLLEEERKEKGEEESKTAFLGKRHKEPETALPENQFGVENLMPLKVSSPLGSTLVSCAKTLSPFSTPEGPHKGVGQPMETRSWLDHPYYFGGFVGRTSGSQLVSGLLDQKSGGHGGFIFGYNLNDYWGIESRLHFSSIDIRETAAGEAAYQEWFTSTSEDAAAYVPKLTTRSNQISILDAAVHYYPLGNTKWRPFFKYGLGFARESFTNTYGKKVRINTAAMPFGAGLRYWWNENLAIQMDLLDNVVFSSDGTKTQNNISFAVGLTYSFGTSKNKRPTVYWPYTPSRGSKW